MVLEERRLRVDNSPLGPFSEAFALASLSNNYRWARFGWRAVMWWCTKAPWAVCTA